MTTPMTAPKTAAESSVPAGADCLVVVSDSVASVKCCDVQSVLKSYSELNAKFEKEVSFIRTDKAPHRLIYAPTGPLNRDYDDPRRIHDAASKGIEKALSLGCKNPHVCVCVPESFFGPSTPVVACVGALNPFYVPVLTRQKMPEKKSKGENITFSVQSSTRQPSDVVTLAKCLDSARWVTRDIGSSDPEVMTPRNVAEYVKALFPAGQSPVKVEVLEGKETFEKDYPLFAAVNRAVATNEKHAGRIIYLEYEGEGPIEQTVYLVGKGVVYDTGGHDLKVGGIMAGMHRDKCGSAAVAGIFKFLHDTKPKGIRIIGGMAMVRNEIGPDAYVADEIITSRAGQRVVITNTDAEGRMAMGDVLCVMKERALKLNDPKPPQLYTIATLTGHAMSAFGPYAAALENGPAKRAGVAQQLQKAGEALADPVEISSMRREDYDKERCPNEYGDVMQTHVVGPSAGKPRGHQTAGVFLVIASGLEKHGIDSEQPLQYCHLDIAGATGYWLQHDPPEPAAVFSLLGMHVIPKLV